MSDHPVTHLKANCLIVGDFQDLLTYLPSPKLPVRLTGISVYCQQAHPWIGLQQLVDMITEVDVSTSRLVIFPTAQQAQAAVFAVGGYLLN